MNEDDITRAAKGATSSWTTLAALGVVYGDIGTSPLYALRECFSGEGSVSVSQQNILGVLSLIFWALIIVISLKYLVYLIRADNHGEGGVLALLALVSPWRDDGPRASRAVLFVGLFGAALLYGDGMITPAISVLSAVEGLHLATPAFEPYVIPVTLLILVVLFQAQRFGTSKVGSVFGPIMLTWFLVLGVLGARSVLNRPEVLAALNPARGVAFLLNGSGAGFAILGAVFLVVTGGEALYADLGHFGAQPIRRAWFAVVLPALLLNYFGQGALLLTRPGTAAQPFYELAPRWALYPLLILATCATVIASQAVISGAFSLTRQAVHLGLSPRMDIRQTSSAEVGQIFIPAVNAILMLATMGLVIAFGSSSHLAGAYGVAVSTTMVITTALASIVARRRWGWNLLVTSTVTVVLLVVDLAFFSANTLKVEDGGWFPLVVGAFVFLLMTTWKQGRRVLAERLRGSVQPYHLFLNHLSEQRPVRIPGTAVFMTAYRASIPPMLLRHVDLNHVLHENVLILNAVTDDVPRVPASERLNVVALDSGLQQVSVRFGFMETHDVPAALADSAGSGLDINPRALTYYVGRETLVTSAPNGGMAGWRKTLFAALSRNAWDASTFYRLPEDQVIELGVRVRL